MHAQAHAQAFNRRGERVQFIILWTCPKNPMFLTCPIIMIHEIHGLGGVSFFCIVTGIALGVFKRYRPPSSQGGPKIDQSSMMLDCFPGSLEP